MKSDTERKRFYNAKLHQKTKRMHVHLSKELRTKLKSKRRSLLVREGDKVRIMRGPGKGKSVKVARVSHLKMRVYGEGITARTAKGREVLIPLQPSNLLLLELEQTKERKELFTEAAFRKEEKTQVSAKKADTAPLAPAGSKREAESKPKAEAKQEPKAAPEAMDPATVEAEVVPGKR
jgi:large subunit ribosomal protein L24